VHVWKYQECIRIGTGRGESVNWEKSRSVIQLCARQKGNEEERNTKELREGRKEKWRPQEKGKKCCEHLREDGKGKRRGRRLK